MNTVRTIFRERVDDIECYFELVKNIESSVGQGKGFLETQDGLYRISPQQQKIMCSGIYLHLYNLVESTVNSLIDAVERHALHGISGDIKLLTDKMRSLYIKSVLGTDDNLSSEKKLDNALTLFNQVIGQEPPVIKIPPGGGGNWDSSEIQKFSQRIGVDYQIPREIKQAISRPFRDDKNPIWLIKVIRNKLAHGSMSFAECGEGHVASDFRRLIDVVKDYLECVIDLYDSFISEERYKV